MNLIVANFEMSHVCLSSWWFQPIRKILYSQIGSNWIISPSFRVQNKEYYKPPTSYTCSRNTSSNLVCCMFLMIKEFGPLRWCVFLGQVQFPAGTFLAACNPQTKNSLTWNPGSYNKSIPNLGSANSEIQKKTQEIHGPRFLHTSPGPKRPAGNEKSAKDKFLAPQFWVENKHVFETTKFRILSMEYFQFWW